MTALCIILAVLLILALVLLIPVGAEAEYDECGVTAWLLIGPFRVILYPRPPKAEDEKRGKKKKEKKKKEPEGEEKTKKGGTLGLIKELIPVGIEALGAFKRGLVIKLLRLYFSFGGEDPAKAAMSFGGASAAAGMIVPLLQRNFKVKDMDIRSNVDFTSEETVVYAHADLRIRLITLLALALKAGAKALRIYLRHDKQKKAAAAARQPNEAEKGK